MTYLLPRAASGGDGVRESRYEEGESDSRRTSSIRLPPT